MFGSNKPKVNVEALQTELLYQLSHVSKEDLKLFKKLVRMQKASEVMKQLQQATGQETVILKSHINGEVEHVLSLNDVGTIDKLN